MAGGSEVVVGSRAPAPPQNDQFDDKYWHEAYDSDSGKNYYYHTTSGYSTWHKPWMPPPEDPSSNKAPKPQAELSDSWTRHFFQELVGSFVAQVLTSGVIWSVVKTTFDALTGPTAVDPPETPFDPDNIQLIRLFQYGSGMFNQLVQAFGVSLAFAMGIGVAQHGQLNPSFTLSMALLGAKKWRHVIPSILGQLTGYFLGCAMFYSLIGPYIPHWDLFVVGGAPLKDATLKFATMFTGSQGPGAIMGGLGAPNEFTMDNASCFWSTTYLTSLMILIIIPIFASPEKMHRSIEPLVIGAVIFSFVLGSQALGATLNPAQYLAGSFFCWICGWPNEIWTHDNYYIWTALLGPILGAIIGCVCMKVYFIVIFHHPAYWLEELEFAIKGVWSGLIAVPWAKIKENQYHAAAAYEPHGRSRAGSHFSHTAPDYTKDDMNEPLDPYVHT